MTATLQPPTSRARDLAAPPHPIRGGAGAPPVALEEMVAALRTIPHGGIDDGARRFALPPQVRATVSPIVLSLRWGSIVSAAVVGVTDALEGSLHVVATLAVCVFLTTWRTTIPLTLASRRHTDRWAALADVAVLAVAAGFSGVAGRPFVPVVVVAVAIAAFGWGHAAGLVAAAVAAIGLCGGVLLSAEGFLDIGTVTALVVLGALVVAGLLPALARTQLVEMEVRRARSAARMDALVQTNDLLTMLNSMARTIPAPLGLREALEHIHEELSHTFAPTVVCLLERDDAAGEWVPKLAEGCVLRPSSRTEDLPAPLRRCLEQDDPIVVDDATDPLESRAGDGIDVTISPASRSGCYVALRVRDRVVGLLGLEHRTPGHFGDRHARLLANTLPSTALTLDNARRFGRLRSLGAEEERSRATRELHDRLGQWLTYISFELERIMSSDSTAGAELGHLYIDVQSALDELRETLRQLQSEVTEGRPLARVGGEVIDRFRERTDLVVSWEVREPGQHLPVPVENELLRILQESLRNIDRHAAATQVDVTWDVHGGTGTLTITDDGRGFDADQGVRDRAYGLVGMRERADVIGARLTIHSTPGEGTTIRVVAGTTDEIQEI